MSVVTEVQPINVLKIIEEGRVGGPQMDILRTTPILIREGIKVSVVIPDKGSRKFQILLSNASIPVYLASLTRPGKNFLQIFRYVLNLIPEIFQLAKLIRQVNPEVIHVGGGSWQVKGVISGWMCRKKVIWHLNDTSTPKLVRAVFSLLRQIPDGFICAGVQVQHYYLPDSSDKMVEVIHSTVDCEEFKPTEQSYDLSDKTPMIVTVGNIGPVKGIEVFLQAINKTKACVDVTARVVGEQLDSQRNYTSGLRKFIQEHELKEYIVFGWTDDVVSELQSADIYVCTSWFEASPTAVWEAMAVGLPVVSTDVGDVKDFVVNGVSGYVVPVGDSNAVAERIIYLLNNPKHAKKIGEKAREIVLEHMDVSHIAKQHLQLYRKVVQQQ